MVRASWHELALDSKRDPIPHCGTMASVDDAVEITVPQLPKFKAEATELIGTEGIEALAA